MGFPLHVRREQGRGEAAKHGVLPDQQGQGGPGAQRSAQKDVRHSFESQRGKDVQSGREFCRLLFCVMISSEMYSVNSDFNLNNFVSLMVFGIPNL